MQTTATPTLTEAQLAEFHERGYVVVDDVFSREELAVMEEELDRLMEEGAGEDAHGR